MRGIHAGIDTATDWLCIALWSAADSQVLARHESMAGRQHASLLLPALKELLAANGLSPVDLTAVGVGTGPGSYTGLRVGLASAQGLASGLSLPLGGTPSLEAVAYRQLAEGQEAWLTWDARRGNVYAGRYLREAGSVRLSAGPEKYSARQLAERAGSEGVDLLAAGVPDAAWIARQALAGGPAEALYL